MPGKIRSAIVLAFAVYIAWTVATWFFEGRIHTLSRPEAMVDRLVYAVLANLVIGTVGVLLALRFMISSGAANHEHAGFGQRSPSVPWMITGIGLGLAFYFIPGAPSTNPMVIVNAYAQVFAVSVAEVLVCWALVGGVLKHAFSSSRGASVTGAALVASLLFGIHHFAHSPPFNAFGMVMLLTAVGFLTSAFFFTSRDIYATIVFHNFLGMYGVVRALAATDKLGGFTVLQVPLLATAVAFLLVLVASDMMIVGRQHGSRAGNDR